MKESPITTAFHDLMDIIARYQVLCETSACIPNGTFDDLAVESLELLREMAIVSEGSCPCCGEEAKEMAVEQSPVYATVELAINPDSSENNHQIQATMIMDGVMFSVGDWIDLSDGDFVLEGSVLALENLLEKLKLRLEAIKREEA